MEKFNSELAIKTEKIRKSLKSDNVRILEINIEYPQFLYDSSSEQISKINSFYKKFAENYEKYCECRLFRKILQSDFKKENFTPYGEIMNNIITYTDEKYISVLTDISHYDGYFIKRERMNHIWSVSKGVILPLNKFLLSPKSRKRIKNEVGKQIVEQLYNKISNFSLTENSVKKYAFNVNTDNFFLCKNGIGFWFEPGTLAPESEGFPSFVIPYKKEELL